MVRSRYSLVADEDVKKKKKTKKNKYGSYKSSAVVYVGVCTLTAMKDYNPY